MKTRAVFYTSRGGSHRGRLLLSMRFARGFLGLSLSGIFAVLVATSAFATDPDPELVAAGKIVASKAYVDTKQDVIQATSDGTGGTPNYIYNQTTNPTADGSVVTTGATDGAVSQRGIATAPVSDGNGGYSNANWLPTVGAMMSQINTATTALSWTSAETAAVNAYSTTFDASSTHTAGNWLYQTNYQLISTTALANSLALKQNIIPAKAQNVDYNSVLTDTSTDGVVGKMQIVTSDYTFSNSLTLEDLPGTIPTSDAVFSELDNYWQPKIPAGLVTFEDGAVQGGTSGEDDLTVRALVATNAAGTTLTGNTIGILDANTLDISDEGILSAYAGYGAEMDNFVPTVRVVADAIGNIWSNMPSSWTAFSWNDNTFPGLIDAYNINFGGNGNWANTPYYLVPAETFVKGLARKQNKITIDKVLFKDVAGTENDIYVPALAVTNAAGTELNANTVGILDYATIYDDEGDLREYSPANGYGAEMDNFVPTVRAVSMALNGISDSMPNQWTAFSWNNNTFPGLIDAYNIDFGGNGNWPNTPNYLVPADTFVKGIARKQNIIPAKAQNSDFYSVLTDTSADGEVGKLGILTAGYMQANGESFASWVPNDNEIVTAGAIHRELLNNWQPIIPASMASNDIGHQTLSLPSFVVANVLTNGASPTLSSGTYGIITQDNIEDYAGLWSEFALLSNMDTAVPTVKAVANAITRLAWNSRIRDAIDGYRTQFFASGDGVWWFSESDKLINTPVFSQGLALKQNKLAAKASDARAQAVTRSAAGNTSSAYITEGGSVGLTTRSGAPAVINYVNGTVATDEEFTTFTNGTFGTATGDTLTNNKNAIKNALVSLELLKDVYSALHTEITSAVPTGTPNTVANYNANGALGAGIATYDASGTYNSANDSGKIATAAAVETRQKKKVCGGYKPGYENNPDYCWLWTFPE